jgi:hypothetical protein
LIAAAREVGGGGFDIDALGATVGRSRVDTRIGGFDSRVPVAGFRDAAVLGSAILGQSGAGVGATRRLIRDVRPAKRALTG